MKTYILTMDCARSDRDYVHMRTNEAIRSCNDMGYDYEVVYGPTPYNGHMQRFQDLLEIPEASSGTDCCAMAHLAIQKRLRETGEKAVIMEYDAHWVRPLKDLPDHGINLSGETRGIGYYVPPSMLDLLLEEQKKAGILAPADWVLNKVWHCHRGEYNHRCNVLQLSKGFMKNYDMRMAKKPYIWYDQPGHRSIRRGHDLHNRLRNGLLPS